MRRLLALAVLLSALAACGASAARTGATGKGIAFGVGGGNMLPFRVAIGPGGDVHAHGRRVARRHLSRATVRRLERDVQRAHLRSRRCPGVLPDVGAGFIRVGSRRTTVHGTCEPRFTRVWNELARAVGLRLG